jgi:hypothetical protein
MGLKTLRRKNWQLQLSIRGARFSWLSGFGSFRSLRFARRAMFFQPNRLGFQPMLSFNSLRTSGLLPKPIGKLPDLLSLHPKTLW